ncbi:hypothetical protein SLS64_002929 [Diaporthe eres]|uniref:Rhodopsin domain-containing protein n=1 Tax=Diaporthe eres TaxID=83184 RepID=A0ABR1PHR6_DIAER
MGSDDANLPARLMSDNVRRQSDHAPAQEGSLTLSEHSTLTTAVVLGCLATISVVIAIRLMVKKMMAPHRLSADDFLVLVAAAFTLSFCMVSLGATMHGLGQHSSDLIDAGIDLRHIIEFMWAGHILYSFAIAFAKLISYDSQSPTIREINTTPDSGRTGGKLVIVEEIVVEPKV